MTHFKLDEYLNNHPKIVALNERHRTGAIPFSQYEHEFPYTIARLIAELEDKVA